MQNVASLLYHDTVGYQTYSDNTIFRVPLRFPLVNLRQYIHIVMSSLVFYFTNQCCRNCRITIIIELLLCEDTITSAIGTPLLSTYDKILDRCQCMMYHVLYYFHHSIVIRLISVQKKIQQNYRGSFFGQSTVPQNINIVMYLTLYNELHNCCIMRLENYYFHSYEFQTLRFKHPTTKY